MCCIYPTIRELKIIKGRLGRLLGLIAAIFSYSLVQAYSFFIFYYFNMKMLRAMKPNQRDYMLPWPADAMVAHPGSTV